MAGYGTDAEAQAYWTAAGYTVPDGNVTAARQRGSVYVDGTYGWRFPGQPTGGADQDRAWPRTGATDVYGNAIGTDVIPQAVVNASYEAALLELQSAGSLSSVVSNAGRVTMERVEGAVTVQYASPGAGADIVSDNTPISTLIAGILYPIIGSSLLMPAVAVV